LLAALAFIDSLAAYGNMLQDAYMRTSLVAFTAVAMSTPVMGQPPARGFVPLVEWPDTTATCADFDAGLQPGERGYSLRFGVNDSSNRVVSAVWDSTGSLRRYSDARGDLRPRLAGGELGPRTTIALDFDKRIALLTNEDRGRSRGNALIPPTEALNASSLGPPRHLLARLHNQCGAPAVKH
jgi:hypothetical protein